MGCWFLARRSRIGIRPASARAVAYRVGVDAGDAKYQAKIPLMKKHKDAAFAVITDVQNLAKQIADKYGVTGTARTVFIKTAERLMHFAVKYNQMRDDDVRAVLEAQLRIELSTSGLIRDVTVPAAVYDRILDAMREMINEIIARRGEWYDVYVRKLTA